MCRCYHGPQCAPEPGPRPPGDNGEEGPWASQLDVGWGRISLGWGVPVRRRLPRLSDSQVHVLSPFLCAVEVAHLSPPFGRFLKPAVLFSDKGYWSCQGLRDHHRADQRRARVPCPRVWRQHPRWVPCGAATQTCLPLRDKRRAATLINSLRELALKLVFDACVERKGKEDFFFFES